jgi:hypothetical protein
VAFKIPQGGHTVVYAVTAASLTLVGAAVSTLVLETPLTQALAAAEPISPTVVRLSGDSGGATDRDTSERARLARCACDRWRRSTRNSSDLRCAVDELVISQDWVVARLNLQLPDATATMPRTPRRDVHAVEVMHLIDGHVDEDWHLASTHERR